MGYNDFNWWNNLDSRKIKFVTHAKENQDYEVVEEFVISREKDTSIIFEENKAHEQYWNEKNQKE